MMLVLLSFRSPPWALLDECTSAVALDGEESMYRHLRDEFHCDALKHENPMPLSL